MNAGGSMQPMQCTTALPAAQTLCQSAAQWMNDHVLSRQRLGPTWQCLADKHPGVQPQVHCHSGPPIVTWVQLSFLHCKASNAGTIPWVLLSSSNTVVAAVQQWYAARLQNHHQYMSCGKAGPVLGIFHLFQCRWSHHMCSQLSVTLRGPPPSSQVLACLPLRASLRCAASFTHEAR
eukprot:GHRR01001628.1.p1 GENE.GHRR01001628.1~~GHRR01001628.1.p1  ORF type:complete len:177 (-),score=29.91 GHRR01001628.1:317-847(-)